MFLKTRFLERRYPGKFDLWGSHSIFHILVVCAAVVQLMGYLDAFDYSHANLARLFELCIHAKLKPDIGKKECKPFLLHSGRLLEMKHAFG